jgi:5'-nucleotidase
MPAHPDLVVSGINYGENVGEGISASGTIGATLEAASAEFRQWCFT